MHTAHATNAKNAVAAPKDIMHEGINALSKCMRYALDNV